MLRITSLTWDEDNVEHIGRHRVSPEEVEDVCYSANKIATRSREGRVAIRGQTGDGRYLLVILLPQGGGSHHPVTARDLTRQEKVRLLRLKRKK